MVLRTSSVLGRCGGTCRKLAVLTCAQYAERRLDHTPRSGNIASQYRTFLVAAHPVSVPDIPQQARRRKVGRLVPEFHIRRRTVLR